MTPPGIGAACAVPTTPNVPDGSAVHVSPSGEVQAGSGVWSLGWPSARFPPAHAVTAETPTGPPSTDWRRIPVHATLEIGGRELLGTGLMDAFAVAAALGDGAPELGLGEDARVVGVGEAPGPVRNPPGRSPSATATMRTAASSVATTRWLRKARTGRRDLRSMAASIRWVNSVLTGRGSIAR